MKNLLFPLLQEYLLLFPQEKERQEKFSHYLNNHIDEEIVNWNNFDGHVVAGGFIYARKEKKFLCIYHKDLRMYLYPGGHIDSSDNTVLAAAKREITEETGLKHLEQFILSNDPLIPIDIDTHKISYNERLKLPEHFHFEFRYLFVIENIVDIHIDREENSCYKWISIEELEKDKNFGSISTKLKKFIEEEENE